mmetsp:Transcript_50294/g.155435  ORF Transcript_50294/g.155435 Transcript_50294/m.155435 type:complete len:214 (-) Transcript_50294:1425-2066(-)
MLVLGDLLPVGTKGACVLGAGRVRHEVFDAHPEPPVIQASVAGGRLHLLGPLALRVLVRPLPGPLARAPRVPAADQLVPLGLHDATYGVGVAANEACGKHRLATLTSSCGNGPSWNETRGQQPALGGCLLQDLEVRARVAPVLLLHDKPAPDAPEHGGDGLRRLPAVAHLEAGVELAEGLLQQRHPHFLCVFAMRKHEVAVVVHWHEVVYDHV